MEQASNQFGGHQYGQHELIRVLDAGSSAVLSMDACFMEEALLPQSHAAVVALPLVGYAATQLIDSELLVLPHV